MAPSWLNSKESTGSPPVKTSGEQQHGDQYNIPNDALPGGLLLSAEESEATAAIMGQKIESSRSRWLDTEISSGKGYYKGYANRVFLAYVERHKDIYRRIPKGKDERKRKRATQMEIFRNIEDVFGLQFEKQASPKTDGQPKRNASVEIPREDSILGKIRAALCRRSIFRTIDGIQPSEISCSDFFSGTLSSDVPAAASADHAPNVVFWHFVLQNRTRYVLLSHSNSVDKCSILLEIYHILHHKLKYKFVHLHPNHSGWVEMAKDEALRFLSAALGGLLSLEEIRFGMEALLSDTVSLPVGHRGAEFSNTYVCTLNTKEPAEAALQPDQQSEQPEPMDPDMLLYFVPTATPEDLTILQTLLLSTLDDSAPSEETTVAAPQSQVLYCSQHNLSGQTADESACAVPPGSSSLQISGGSGHATNRRFDLSTGSGTGDEYPVHETTRGGMPVGPPRIKGNMVMSRERSGEKKPRTPQQKPHGGSNDSSPSREKDSSKVSPMISSFSRMAI